MEEHISYEKIKGAVGSLLVLWVEIERVIREELSRLCDGNMPKSARRISSALDAWEAAMSRDPANRPFQALLASRVRAKLQRPLEIRNGVCQGLRGIFSSHDGKTPALTWELNGKMDRVTWDQLQDTCAWLSTAPRAISRVSYAAAESDHAKAASLLPDRDWWLGEFGIELPMLQNTFKAAQDEFLSMPALKSAPMVPDASKRARAFEGATKGPTS